MCGGCVSSIGNALGSILYVLERIASCCAFTALVTCIIASLTVVLGLGIGLGYNYCLVQVKTPKAGDSGSIESATDTTVAEITGAPPKNSSGDRNRRFGTSEDPVIYLQSQDTAIKPTMSIPINNAIDFLGLISKIRKYKKPVTLELFG